MRHAPLALVFILAGCSDVPEDPLEGHEPNTCPVHVGWPTNTTEVLRLDFTAFQAGAPVLAGRLQENRSGSQPFDIGGVCDSIQTDLRWLFDAYENQSGAEFDPDAQPGPVRYHFEVRLEEETYGVSFIADLVHRHIIRTSAG